MHLVILNVFIRRLLVALMCSLIHLRIVLLHIVRPVLLWLACAEDLGLRFLCALSRRSVDGCCSNIWMGVRVYLSVARRISSACHVLSWGGYS